MTPSSHRPFKDALHEQLARVARAAASPARLELLDLLGQGERSVDSLASELGQSIANTSQQLQVLRRAHLVVARRAGVNVYYSLAGPAVFALYRTVRELAVARLTEVDHLVRSFLADRQTLEPLTNAELVRRLRRRDVVLIDVRPATEYFHGHIRGARSMPLDALGRRLGELRSDREIVAYCRGPFCIFADEAVALLRQRGFRARRLATGFPDWRAEGLPVDVGAEAPAGVRAGGVHSIRSVRPRARKTPPLAR